MEQIIKDESNENYTNGLDRMGCTVDQENL